MSKLLRFLSFQRAALALIASTIAIAQVAFAQPGSASERKTSRVEIRTEARIPWPCVIVEERNTLIQFDRSEVVADANLQTRDDATMATHQQRLQQRRAAGLLSVSANARLQGCAWVDSRELGDAYYYVVQRVAQGRATLIDKPSGVILPFVTVVRVDRGDPEYAISHFRLPDDRWLLPVAPPTSLAPPRASSGPDSGVARPQSP